MPIEIHPMKAKVKDEENNWHYIDGFSSESEEVKESLKSQINTLSERTIKKVEQTAGTIQELCTNAGTTIERYIQNVKDALPDSTLLENYAKGVQKWQFKPLKWTKPNCYIKYRLKESVDPYGLGQNSNECPILGDFSVQYDCAIIQPEDPNGTLAGEEFLINGQSGLNAIAWFFLDENKHVIPNTEGYDQTDDNPITGQGFSTITQNPVINKIVFGPQGAKKLILNNNKSAWEQAQDAICYQKVKPYDIMDKHEQFIEALQNNYKIDTNSITWLNDTTIDLNNGKIKAASNDNHYKCSDKIINCDYLTIEEYVNNSTTNYWMYCYIVSYTADDKFLESEELIKKTGAMNVVYKVSSEAAYIRICYRAYIESDIKFKWSGFYRSSCVPNSDQTSTIPAYWDNMLDSVRTKIIQKDLALSDSSSTTAYGDRFFFVTDPHFRAQKSKMSSCIIDALAAEFNINLCLLGGDNIATHVVDAEAGYKEIFTYISSFKNPKLRLFATAGNHDMPSQPKLNDLQLYNVLMRQMEDFAVTTANITGAYYDNEARKIRYVQFYNTSLSDCYNDTRKNWLEAVCLDEKLKNGWAIVVMSHCCWNNGEIKADSKNWASTLLELKKDGAPIVLWLVGHTHKDNAGFLTKTFIDNNDDDTTVNLLVVSTTTDNVSSGQTGEMKIDPETKVQITDPNASEYITVQRSNRADYTDTESAFDIVHLDTEAKKVYFTRVGGWFVKDGDNPDTGDRAFNYDNGKMLNYDTGAEREESVQLISIS